MYVKAKGVFFHYPHFLRQCLLLNLALTDLGRQLLQRPVSTFSSLGLQTSTTAPSFWEDLGDPNSARVGAYIITRTYTFSLSLSIMNTLSSATAVWAPETRRRPARIRDQRQLNAPTTSLLQLKCTGTEGEATQVVSPIVFLSSLVGTCGTRSPAEKGTPRSTQTSTDPIHPSTSQGTPF